MNRYHLPIAGIQERIQRPTAPEPITRPGDSEGPKDPGVRRPDPGNDLLKRMRKVDPDQAKRYRQRSGQ